MSEYKEQPQRKLKENTYPEYGEDWRIAGYPLTMESDIIEIRKEIEKKSVHKGARRTLTKAAYNEMRLRQRQGARNMDCGSCMRDINHQLNIWFKLYDQRTEAQKKSIQKAVGKSDDLELTDIMSGSTDDDSLLKMDDRHDAIKKMEYYDLCAKAKDELSPQKVLELFGESGKKVAKKSKLQDELIKLLK